MARNALGHFRARHFGAALFRALAGSLPDEYVVSEAARPVSESGGGRRRRPGQTWRDVALARDEDDVLELVTILLSVGVVK